VERYGTARDVTNCNIKGRIKDTFLKPDMFSKNTQSNNISYSFSMAKMERRNRLKVT